MDFGEDEGVAKSWHGSWYVSVILTNFGNWH